MELKYRLLNVFALRGDPFSGNPLCVFEDGRGLNAATMQALARQFNLSETTFIMPSSRADALVRIFTPEYEMPFAGHPTLGTAAVVFSLAGSSSGAAPSLSLEMQVGLIPVKFDGALWTLRANPATTRENTRELAELAAALGLAPDDIVQQANGPRPLWVNAGVEQLLVPLASPDAVRRVQPNISQLTNFLSSMGKRQFLVFAATSEDSVLARFFFENGPAVLEDPATGSAGANLGGWFLQTGVAKLRKFVVSQGESLSRPSRLHLELDSAGQIFVGGRVIELGTGSIRL
jgi:trans-2,3-dihydro-3-hydroxyanthranilate isomerase